MPNVRMTFFFSASSFSWTEGLYTQSQFTSLTDVETAAAKIADYRSQLLGINAQLDEVRLSYADVNRESSIVDSSLYRHTQTWIPSGVSKFYYQGAPSWTALIVRLEAINGHRKLIFLSGFPNGMVSDDGGAKITPDIPPVWLQNFRNWRGRLKLTAAWRAQKNVKDGNPNFPVITLGLAGMAGSRIKVGVAFPGPAVVSGNRIQVSGFKHVAGAVRQINGYWTIGAIDNTVPAIPQYELIGSEGIKTTDYIMYGYIKQRAYDFFAVDSAVFSGATHRKRGVRSARPLGKSRTAK